MFLELVNNAIVNIIWVSLKIIII